MKPFSNKSKSKRPKFLFKLKINELTNIPQSSGYCYVKWHLKDGTGTSGHHAYSPQTKATHPVSNQSKGITPRVLVRNHRARWNYSLENPIQVKLTVDRNRKLNEKLLVLEVYFEFLEQIGGNVSNRSHSRTSSNSSNTLSHSNSSYTQKISSKLLLGTVTINIAEYINRGESVISNRFLLQKSKINSILSLDIQMELIRGTFDDFELPQSFSSGQLPSSFRNGISEVLDDSSDMNSPVSSTFHASNGGNTNSPTSAHGPGYSVTKQSDVQCLTTIAISNPLVEKLYQKTFQIPWDPRPGEYTPKECIEDILDGGNGWAKNEKGVNLIDLEALRLSELENDHDLHSTSTDLSYQNLDRREYLEKRSNWEMLSRKHQNIHKNKSAQDLIKQNVSNFYEDTADCGLEEHISSEIKDSKSWTITTILP